MEPHILAVTELRSRLDAQCRGLAAVQSQLEHAVRLNATALAADSWNGMARRRYDDEVDRLMRDIGLARQCVFEALQHSARARATLANRVG